MGCRGIAPAGGELSCAVSEAFFVPVADRHSDHGHHSTMTSLCGFVPFPEV